MILKKEFYERETVTVAKQLIGKTLTRKIQGTKMTGIIIETEAYRGKNDLASHAATNVTKRNKIMFGPVGMSYVYFTYGMYFMLNVVAKSKKQNAGAVLIRGIYPQDGIKIMIKNRGIKDVNKISDGPGKLTMAMNIHMSTRFLQLKKNFPTKNNFLVKAGFVTQKGKFGSFKKAKQTKKKSRGKKKNK